MHFSSIFLLDVQWLKIGYFVWSLEKRKIERYSGNDVKGNKVIQHLVVARILGHKILLNV